MLRSPLALLLAAVTGLAPAVLAMAAAAMSPATAVSDSAGRDMCPGCADGDADADICGTICLTASQSGCTLAGCYLLEGDVQRDYQVVRRASLSGLSPPPEPAPPKAVSSR